MIVYVSVASVVPVLLIVFTIELELTGEDWFVFPVTVPPVIPVVHEYCAPERELARLIVNCCPLHNVVVDGVALRSGSGLTVTSKLKLLPAQPSLDGMMVYLTTAFAEFELFVRTSLMVAPVPAAVFPVAAPEITVEVQLKVLPGCDAVMPYATPVPLQIVLLAALVILLSGLITTITVSITTLHADPEGGVAL